MHSPYDIAANLVSKKPKQLLLILSILVGVGLMLLGGYGLWQRYHSTHLAHPVIPTHAITSSTTHPEETPPPCSSYRVPAAEPLRITLPTINTSGCIEKVGFDQKNNAVGAPSNVYLAGWYIKTVLPGNPGLSLIDGHIQGYYKPGIFKHLADLKTGDIFQVESGDHTKRSFQVVRVTSYPVNTAATFMLQQDPSITHQLNIITCGGSYDKTAKEYTQRTLVVSKLIT